MSQIVLYRKYRSNNFDEIVGQEHVTTTLKNAVKSGEVSHAYLFSGPRGIGKTSFARILSRAVNCLNLQNGYNPCNQCENCQAFLQQSSLDIVEVDAASHRGIDDIRFLQEGVSFAPVGAKRKVFIIDEVHMLTKEAFNALLKTLEEPPVHAMFILATTEIEKVPETIVSRCQTFFLRRLNESEIANHLQKIATAEGRSLDLEVAKLIASSVKGGMRDALGVLEQALVLDLEIVTKENVYGVLGLVENEVLIKITDLILLRDLKESLRYYLNEIYFQGVDVFRLMKSLEWYWRDMLLDLYGKGDEKNKQLTQNLLIMLDELQLTKTKQYDIDSLYFEIFLIRTVERIGGDDGKQNLANDARHEQTEEKKTVVRDENVKKKIDSEVVASNKQINEKENKDELKTDSVMQNVGKNNECIVGELTEQIVMERWEQILKSVQSEMPLVGSILKMSKVVAVKQNKIVLGVNFALQKNQLMNLNNLKVLQTKLIEIFGRAVEIDVEVVKSQDDIKKKQQEIVDEMNNQVDQQTGEKLLKEVLAVFDGEIIK